MTEPLDLDRMKRASYLLPDPGGEVVRDLIEELREARAEIDRLKAIVAKLPKTADGVPVVPGMEVWEEKKCNGGIHSFTAFCIGTNCYIYSEFGRRCHSSTLFDSREAAEATDEKPDSG